MLNSERYSKKPAGAKRTKLDVENVPRDLHTDFAEWRVWDSGLIMSKEGLAKFTRRNWLAVQDIMETRATYHKLAWDVPKDPSLQRLVKEFTCAAPGCSRERYSETLDHCCKRCWVTRGKEHETSCRAAPALAFVGSSGHKLASGSSGYASNYRPPENNWQLIKDIFQRHKGEIREKSGIWVPVHGQPEDKPGVWHPQFASSPDQAHKAAVALASGSGDGRINLMIRMSLPKNYQQEGHDPDGPGVPVLKDERYYLRKAEVFGLGDLFHFLGDVATARELYDLWMTCRIIANKRAHSGTFRNKGKGKGKGKKGTKGKGKRLATGSWESGA